MPQNDRGQLITPASRPRTTPPATDDTAPGYLGATWPDRVHEQVEYEVEAAYWLGRLEGRAEGVEFARTAYSKTIEEALRRPPGHGGLDLDEVARGIVQRLYRDYLGVGA